MDNINLLQNLLPPPYKNDNINFEKIEKKLDYEEENIINDKILTLLHIIPYSTKYSSIIKYLSDKSMSKLLNVFENYKNVVIDLCNPKKTLNCKTLAYEYMMNAKELLNIDVDPFPDPHDDIKYMLSGTNPFHITTSSVILYDPELTFIENMFIQTVGTKMEIIPPIVYVDFYEFGFKNYIKHNIPLKRVINGASTCYCDPYSETYYVTQFKINKYTTRILKNLLIYGREKAKPYYLESAIKYIVSMCTDEEDYKLMKEYGIISHINGNYNEFIEIIKELKKYMVGCIISSYWKWHYEMIKITNYKEKLNNNEDFKVFAKKQYSSSGILDNKLDIYLYKNLI